MEEFPREVRVCNFCRSSNADVVIDGRYGKVAQCRQCGLMFRMTRTVSQPVEHAGGAQRLAAQFEAKQVIQLADQEKCFAVIENCLPISDRSLLEIGSFTGHFLDLARSRGWQVKGVEPDANAASRSRDLFNLDVTVSDLRGSHLPAEAFDVVVMFHVIEHFLDPMAELAEIRRVLKPHGMLVVETPRFDTVWFRLLKERERSVIPDHFYYFTRKSLAQIVAANGFSVASLQTVGRTLAADRLFTNVAKVIGVASASRLLVRTAETLHLNRVTLHVNTGDMMRLYAQKI